MFDDEVVVETSLADDFWQLRIIEERDDIAQRVGHDTLAKRSRTRQGEAMAKRKGKTKVCKYGRDRRYKSKHRCRKHPQKASPYAMTHLMGR